MSRHAVLDPLRRTLGTILPVLFLTMSMLMPLACARSRASTSARPETERTPELPPRRLLTPAVERRLAEFERRRIRGSGVFIDGAALERWRGARLSDVLRTVPGIALVSLGGTRFAVAASLLGSAMRLRPDGPLSACFVDVLLDGVRLTTGPITMPVDIDDIAPSRLVALEFHRASRIPSELAIGARTCGLLALWSGR